MIFPKRILSAVLAALLALCAPLTLAAQGKGFAVTGTVRDAGGETLVGVFVQVKGTRTGTTTDLDGNWKLNLQGPATLVFQYIGMSSNSTAVIGHCSERPASLPRTAILPTCIRSSFIPLPESQPSSGTAIPRTRPVIAS